MVNLGEEKVRASLQSMAELDEISRVQSHFSPRVPRAMRPKTHACNPACMVVAVLCTVDSLSAELKENIAINLIFRIKSSL